MPSITYTHSPADTVWVLTTDCGIKHGTVNRVEFVDDGLTQTLIYNVTFDSETTENLVDESTVYAEADLATALVDYQTQLTA